MASLPRAADSAAATRGPAAVCYPFANDRSTTKVYGSIGAEKNDNPFEVDFGRELRHEIAATIHEFAGL